ncbi:glycoside hydrolase family 25 protein [Halobacteriovorax sp.]|uniref:glycoside hydrolase family 25 protein n=1 Tax=Halobacteriovorax sp. TaxID=2020862 RepID=UPI0035644DA6
MRETKRIKLILLAVVLLSFSCVKEDDCDTNTNTNTTNISSDDSIEADEKCSDGEPDDGDVTTPTEPDPDPDPNPDPGETDQASLNRPWERSDTSIIIDAYEGNGIDWDEMATDTKVVGVIHRSSIGARVDKKYFERKAIALERGYLWGAYHLGRRGDTIAQADLFLDLIGEDLDTLMILDLEDTASSSFMSIEEAIVFMEYVYEKTGQIPTVYANHSTTKKLNTLVEDNPIFQQSKLWYARFKSHVTDYPGSLWKNYFMWQFSSEINCSRTGTCLYNVPGTEFDMDVNVFNGPPAELINQWNNY